MKNIKYKLIMLGAAIFFLIPGLCQAMPPGTLLYRTSGEGKMFGYSQDPLIEIEGGIVRNVYAGHVAVYIGKENGEDYIVEAMGGGIVKNPAKYFINKADGETFLGARMPTNVSALQQARVVALAKSLVGQNYAYDLDFHAQKGPGDGDWTCVGLAEKLYESANIANPNDVSTLEYNSVNYAVDITPDGFDNLSVVNEEGDCFARDTEFSKIARRNNMIIPAPEVIGYDLGLVRAGERYIFLPYTQFLQPTLTAVAADVEVFSSFSRDEVNGSLDMKALAVRWSLINNPLSTLQSIAGTIKELAFNSYSKVKEIAQGIGQKLFNLESETELTIINDDFKNENQASATKKVAAVKKTTVSKAISTKKADPVKKSTKAKSDKILSVETDNNKSVSVKVNAGKNLGLEVTAGKSSNVKVNAVKTATSTAIKATSTAKLQASAALTQKAPSQPYYSPVVSGGSSSNYSSGSQVNTATVPAAETYPKLALINKIYSTGANDWVEIVNPTNHDFDLAAAGYRLEKAKTAEDPSLLVRIGDEGDGSYPGGIIIKAHDTYLIVSSGANSYYLNQADAIVAREGFTWPGSGYTLFLGTDAISSSTDSDIVDAVGFGADATYFVGSGPAPAITDNHILRRASSSDDNSFDFNLILSDDPSIIPDTEAQATTTATTTAPVATSTPETATTTPLAGDGREIVIQKIYSTGDNDWVEIFNPTDLDFDLAAGGFRLEKAVSADDPSLLMRIGDEIDGFYPGGTVIAAHGSYLIVRDEANSFYLNQADAIATRTEFTWSGNGHSIYLGSDAISASTDEDIVDLVGFGAEATYYDGEGAALEITDAFVLNRLTNTHNNSTDFNLIASDDPDAIIPEEDANPDLYAPSRPITSSGLRDVWHFNECYGPGSWSVGKWDCGRLIGNTNPPLLITLSPLVNMNEGFSMSYYYKKTYGDGRLNTVLSNGSGASYSITVGDGYLQAEGLPESEFRYWQNIPSDFNWHKVVLVVNQAADYWEIYIDGLSVAREMFMQNLPTMSDLQIKSDSNDLIFDELALWNRPLSGAEIVNHFALDAPYSPMSDRSAQEPAELLHLWSFEEDAGLFSRDIVGGAILNLAPNAWVGRSHNNYAIKSVAAGRVHSAFLPNFPVTKDLSMGFWWRDRSDPFNGQADIYLTGGVNNEKKLFYISADNYRLDYWFNNKYGILAEGLGTAIPGGHDWHYLNYVYDSYRYKLSFYVDGEEKASTSLIWMPDTERITGLKIVTPGDEAEIDDLSIWKGALSARQVKEIYTNNK